MEIHLKKMPKKLNHKELDKYKIKTYTKKIIYSNEGIYHLHDDYFSKLQIIDDKSEKITLGDTELLCDFSKKIHKRTNKRPFFYTEQEITIDKYTLRKNSPLTFYIEYHNNVINELYFISKDEDIKNFSIQEDIKEFLKYINTL